MHANKAHVGYYIIPFAVGNFLGPLVLGRCSTGSGGGQC
jgi:hypothetical protein